MINLPMQFEGKGEVKGINFQVIERKGLVVITERSDGYYEVCTLRVQQPGTRIIGGREVNFEHKEIYPSGDNWNGKCVSSLEKARAIFRKLT